MFWQATFRLLPNLVSKERTFVEARGQYKYRGAIANGQTMLYCVRVAVHNVASY